MPRLNPLVQLRKLLRAQIAQLRRARRGLIRVGPKKPVPPPKKKPAKPPAGAAIPVRGRPADNTTCDVYFGANAPPAGPDVAGIHCALLPAFNAGAESSEGDQTLRYTHVLTCNAGADIRDSYPAAPGNHVYIPDSSGTRFEVVFVELVNRGLASAYLRVYLDRQQPTWPTTQL
jgi:hypothetical protein